MRSLARFFQCALSKGFSSVSTYIRAFSVHSFTRGLPREFSQWLFPCAPLQGFSQCAHTRIFSCALSHGFYCALFQRSFFRAVCLWRFFLPIFCCIYSLGSFAGGFPVMLTVAGSSSVNCSARFFPVFSSTGAFSVQFCAEVYQVQSFIGVSSVQSLTGIFHALFCRGYFCVFLHRGFLRTLVAGNFSLISFPAFCPSGFSLGLFACSFWQGFFRCALIPGLFPSALSRRRFPCDFSLRFSLLRSIARASSMHSLAGFFLALF